MSGPPSRIQAIAKHLAPASAPSPSPSPVSTSAAPTATPYLHTLSPTFFLERTASLEPNAQAVYHITTNGAVLRRTYQELADRARGLAYYVKEKGFRHVGIVATNTPAHLEATFGVPAAGGVIVPVNYRLSSDDITYILDFAEVDAVIVDHDFVDLLHGFREKHPNVPIIVDTDTDVTEGPACGPFNEAVQQGLAFDRERGSRGWAGLHAQAKDENDTIGIAFTSGTTSRPKGVMLSHRGAYLAAMAALIEAGLNNGHCKYLWTLPMFHAAGWCFPWAVTAVRGVHVCLRKIEYPLVWKLLREQAITHFCAAPTVNTLLVASKEAARLPNPVQVVVAASPPSGYLFEQMTKLNLHPVHTYGMTETYGPITRCYALPEWDQLPLQEKYARMARQGHGFITSAPIRVIKTDQPEGVIVDVAKDGKEIGEVVFAGNICAKGYFKNPEATAKLFDGGVLHSGDLAVWHPDGSAQILDRAKDIIISGGENISSVALESILVQHPDILEAGVVAVSDPQWGERPKAYITVKEGKQLTADRVIHWAKHESGMSGFMVPRDVEILDELPKTSTGKIKKNELREWAKTGRKA